MARSILRTDSDIGRLFRWLTKIGAGPVFGSRPIGWYQQDQMDSLKCIETRASLAFGDRHKCFELKVRQGDILVRPCGSTGTTKNIGSARGFYAGDVCKRDVRSPGAL